MAGKTLAKKPAADAATLMHHKVADLRDNGKLESIEAAEDAADDMVARILEAETDAEMFSATTPISALVGVIIKINGVNFLPSSKRDNPFAVFRWDATDGRSGVTSNGGKRLVATLLNAVDRDRLPLTCKVDSAEVEYEEGQFGTTYFLTPAG